MWTLEDTRPVRPHLGGGLLDLPLSILVRCTGVEMLRQSVESSNLQSVGYDPETQVLEIAFHNGGVYQYLNVPAEQYHALMGAASLGSEFHQRIRDRYPFRRID